ncbi:MAG: hypothetical protein ACK5UC_03960 [Planctomycetaceae bacterium]|jgi:hypothetical protein
MSANDHDFDLKITKTSRRAFGGGTWICGTIDDQFQFDALGFPEQAECPDYEIADSRIANL